MLLIRKHPCRSVAIFCGGLLVLSREVQDEVHDPEHGQQSNHQRLAALHHRLVLFQVLFDQPNSSRLAVSYQRLDQRLEFHQVGQDAFFEFSSHSG